MDTETPSSPQTQAINDDGSTWAAAAPAPPPAAAPPPSPADTLAAAQNPDRSAIQPENAQTGANAGSPTSSENKQIVVQPVPLKPVRAGLLGIVDKLADALTGKTTPEIYEDPDGNKFVHHPNLSPGQQWSRIGAELAVGAARGYAAGQGAGGEGRAAVAGINTGMQFRQQEQDAGKEMDAEARQSMLDKANAQMMRMKLAEQTWKLARLQPDADAQTASMAQAQGAKFKDAGGIMIGTMQHAGELSNLTKTTPNVAEELVQKGTLNPIPHYVMGPDGDWKLAGIEVWKMPDQWRSAMLPQGSTFERYNPQTKQIEQQKASDPMTAGEQADYHINAFNAMHKDQLDAQTLADKTADTANKESEKTARDKELSSKIAEHRATAEKSRQEGLKAAAETRNLNNGLTADGRSRASATGVDPLNPLDQALIVDGLMDGTLDVVKTFAGRNGSALRAQYEAYAKQRDPKWTMAKFDIAHKAQMEYASNEKNAPGGQITSFNYMVGHAGDFMGQIDRLRNSNSPLMNKPLNWLAKNAEGNSEVAEVYIPMDNLRTEFQKFIDGSSLTESDKKEKMKKLNEDLTPAQMEGVAREMMGTGAIRLGALNQGFKRSVGKDYPGLLDDQTKGIMQQAANGTDPSSRLLKATLDYHLPGWNGQQRAPQAAQPAAAQAPRPAPARPANVPANAIWNPTANNGRGMWTPPPPPQQ